MFGPYSNCNIRRWKIPLAGKFTKELRVTPGVVPPFKRRKRRLIWQSLLFPSQMRSFPLYKNYTLYIAEA
jgi:hypothetical protein